MRNREVSTDSNVDSMAGSMVEVPQGSDVEQITAIAVMGVTGSGKSNFIKHATDSARIKVGHGLQSCTEIVEQYEMLLNGRQVILFDTPGFDDTYRLDADILAELAETFSASYKNGLQLAGIIYVKKISDNRMTNSLLKNLSMLRNICGDEPLQNVVILTTFWDTENQSDALKREKELASRSEWLGQMLAKGAKMRRFLNTPASAHAILEEFIDKQRVTLQIQTEMVEKGLEVKQTQAGAALNQEVTALAAQHAQELHDLEAKMEEAMRQRDVGLQNLLAVERAEKEKDLTRMQHEQMAMERDRSEELRRMEQTFHDQLLRLVEERKDRDVQLAALQRQLADERNDAQRRYDEAMRTSEANLAQITQRFDQARDEDKRRFELQIREYKSERDATLREYKEQTARTNDEIVRMFEEKQGASDAERRRLEEEIAALRRKKRSDSKLLWAKIAGVTLCTVLGPFTGGLSSLAIPLFSAMGLGSGSSDSQGYGGTGGSSYGDYTVEEVQ